MVQLVPDDLPKADGALQGVHAPSANTDSPLSELRLAQSELETLSNAASEQISTLVSTTQKVRSESFSTLSGIDTHASPQEFSSAIAAGVATLAPPTTSGGGTYLSLLFPPAPSLTPYPTQHPTTSRSPPTELSWISIH